MLGNLTKRITFWLSLPWCCVSSLVIVLFTTGGSMVSVSIDHFLHDTFLYILPLLVVMHGYGVYRFTKEPHATKGKRMFVVMSTILFLASLGFHFTDFHDELLGEPALHHEHK